jgi:hypothetical protein
MNKENNFEVKNIDLEEMNEIIEIKDDELKTVTGGGSITLLSIPKWRCNSLLRIVLNSVQILS